MNETKMRKKTLFYALNALVPVTLCVVLFVLKNRLLWPRVVALLGQAFGNAGADIETFENALSFTFIYLRDFLWSYALVFAVTYWNSKTREEIRCGFAVATLFELGILVLERFTAMNGVFDLRHLLALTLGTLVGMGTVLVRERELKEKRNKKTVHAVEVVLILLLFTAGAIGGTIGNKTVQNSVTEIAEAATYPPFAELTENR